LVTESPIVGRDGRPDPVPLASRCRAVQVAEPA
jgi:hypothetical protein